MAAPSAGLDVHGLLDDLPASQVPLPPIVCAGCGRELAARIVGRRVAVGAALCLRCAHPTFRACGVPA